MALAVAFDEVKNKQRRVEADGTAMLGGAVSTLFLGSRQALLNQFDLGKVSLAHFHKLDQFQVVVGGKGTIGRHDLVPYSVHFARAYTPYGPLVADSSNGLVFFNLRTRDDPGSQRLPEKHEQLKQVPDRQPWQITRRLTFPKLQSGTATDFSLQAVPGIKDDKGLAAYTLSMKPNAKTSAPDPAQGNGQYLVVVKGSLLHNHKEYKAPALVFVEPSEGPLPINAGPEGLEGVVLNFPKSQLRTKEVTKKIPAKSGFKVWQCTMCSFAYDESLGMPEEGISPGTPWEDVPDTWACPDCSASKSDFQMVVV